ncbi:MULTISPECIES: hypothetical protein [Bacillus subtilis group]|uniref:hypothetical protein n=1 Tax=Bacillus subtilis group TaxID=653685 RepID=UPI000B3E883E|nr:MULTISPECIES: hypothetical protein [Bacillus subtilis group]ARW41646.1 hypothetical protein S100141_00323 [Bacillus licheniformis]MCA1182412.1 hypothetical protein [Bacillus licheniformis]MEC0474922.1 hypothetical protein [Bacillus licheniformis]PRS16485.1 hypothetical protein C6W27_08755 [Bacillus paralicheniformis]
MRKKRTMFEECEFVGKGEEDIRDILKRQFVRYINDEKGYPYLGLKGTKSKNELDTRKPSPYC